MVMLVYARISCAAAVVRLAASAAVVAVLLAAAPADAAPGDLVREVTGASSAPQFTEFPLPTEGGFPQDAVAGPDGSVWYTIFLQTGGKVGRITRSGSISEWAVPGLGHPWGITVGPDGNLWFTITGDVGKIGRITPTGEVSEFSLPTVHVNQTDIAAGPDGNLWYVEARNNGSPGAIGRITPAGVVTEFDLPPAVGVSGLIYMDSHITAGPDGNLWFTATDAIGRITPAGAVALFRLQGPGLLPAGIVRGADGNLWFAENGARLDPLMWHIGRITPSGETTEFPIPSRTPFADPWDITTGSDGAIWFTDISSAGRIGRMTPAGVTTDLFPAPTPASRPQGLTVGPDGELWFVEEEANQIARLRLNGAQTTLYVDQRDGGCSAAGSGSADQPFCTIGAAAAVAGAGDTVEVAPGRYREEVTPGSGEEGAPVVFRAARGGEVTVTGAGHGFSLRDRRWVTVEGFHVSETSGDGIYVANSAHIRLTGNHVDHAGLPEPGKAAKGIRLSNSRDSQVERNSVEHNSDYGIYLVNGSAHNQVTGNTSAYNARRYERAASGIRVFGAPANTISGNTSHDNEDTGIELLGGAAGSTLSDNRSERNGDYGMQLSGAGGAELHENTVRENGSVGIRLQDGSSNARLEGNVSVDNAGAAISVDASSTAGTRLDRDALDVATPRTLVAWAGMGYRALAAFATATGHEQDGVQDDPSPGLSSGGSSAGVSVARTTTAHTGQWAAEVVNRGTAAAATCGLNDAPDWIPATLNGPYRASLWVRGPQGSAGTTLTMRVAEWNGGTRVGSETASVQLTSDFQRVEVGYSPVAPGISHLDLTAWVSKAAPGTCFYADDPSITRAGSAAGFDWPSLHADAAGTGWNPWEGTLTAASVAGLTERWHVDGPFAGSPILSDGRLFVTLGNELVAIRRSDGAVQWRAALPGDPQVLHGNLASAGGLILVTTGHELRAYVADTGALAWSAEVGEANGPTILDQTVYVGSYERGALALDLATGTVRWRTTLPEPLGYTFVAAASGRVFVTSLEGRLSALDASTGELLWDVTDLGGIMVNAGAAVYGGVVYVAGRGPEVSAFKASTGQLLWRKLEGEEPHGVPTVDARAVYIADIDGYVRAYDRTTGTQLWKAHVDGEIMGSLALAGGVVYALTERDQVVAFDASTGTPLWMDQPTLDNDWVSSSSPAVADGSLYVGFVEAGLRAYGLTG
jgi:parallel beta-helix repeat protein